MFRGLAELGCFGMKIDKKYGGLGLSNLDYCRALTLAGSVSPSIGALLSAHQSIGVPQPLKLFGTDEQKQRFLPRLAAGEVSAFLLTEPDVGSDPARLSAIATPVEGGYRLNGVKLWATNGSVATLLVVMALVPRARARGGITAFVVEGTAEGVTVERRNAFLGLRGLENSVTRFHDVFVPAENVIGGEGQGPQDRADHAQHRPPVAAGDVRGRGQVVPQRRAAAGRPSVSNGDRRSASTRPWRRSSPSSRPPPTAWSPCSSCAACSPTTTATTSASRPRWSSSSARRRPRKVADELLQVRGGRGYETADSLAARGEKALGVEQILRDLRINRIFEGSTEIMHLFIAREAVDQHLSVAGDIIDPKASLGRKSKAAAKAAGFYARWLPTLFVGGHLQAVPQIRPPGQTPALRRPCRPAPGPPHVPRHGPLAGQDWSTGRRSWARIVDIGAELFAIAAVCSRARASGRVEEVELADLFCRQARQRIVLLEFALWHNTDAEDVALAKKYLSGRYDFLEDGIVNPVGEGEWVATWKPGPSTEPNLLRRVERATAAATVTELSSLEGVESVMAGSAAVRG